METAKRFNLKALFRGGKLDRLIVGDFGPVGDKPTTKVDRMSPEDSLIAWNVDPEMTGWDTMREIEGIGLSLAGKDREPTDIVGALVPHIRKAYPEARVSYSHTNRGTALRVYVEPKEGRPFTLPISRAVVYACKFYPANA